MSSAVSSPARPEQPHHDEDPFRYGWRYVRQTLADGTVTYVQQPLTLEDVFHPQEGDFIVNSYGHILDCTYLHTVLHARYGDNPAVTVRVDHRVAWDAPGVIPNGPDVAVFFDVKTNSKKPTFNVAAEEARPVLVIEITSEETRANDFGKKMEEYYKSGVQLYVIVDAEESEDGEERTLTLHGYHHTPAGYVEFAPNEKGWLWLGEVGIWLGQKDGQVICYEADGQEIGDYTTVVKTLKKAQRTVAKEERARKKAEAKAAREEQARLAAETRVIQEEQARLAAETRAREAEEKLRFAFETISTVQRLVNGPISTRERTPHAVPS